MKRHLIKVDGRSMPVMFYDVKPTTTGQNHDGSPAEVDFEIRIHFPEFVVRCHLDDHEIHMPIPKADIHGILKADIKEITTERKTRRGPGDYHPENGGIMLNGGKFLQCHCGVIQLDWQEKQRYAEKLEEEREGKRKPGPGKPRYYENEDLRQVERAITSHDGSLIRAAKTLKMPLQKIRAIHDAARHRDGRKTRCQ